MTYATTTPVPTRYNAGYVYDSFRNKLVLFSGALLVNGGLNNSLNDTWEFDLTTKTWALITTVHAPNGRTGHAMSYDPVNHVVVLFGGWHGTSGTGTNDTWTYDGTDWTQQNADGTGGVPNQKNYASLTYDSYRGKHYLYGGADGYNNAVNGLWEYDVGANTWTFKSPSGGSPGNRYLHVPIYDSNRKKLVITGGMSDFYSNFYNDVWEYDPNSGGDGSWVQVIQNRDGSGSYTGGSSNSTTWPAQPNYLGGTPYTGSSGYASISNAGGAGAIIQWSGTAWSQIGGFTPVQDYKIGSGASYGLEPYNSYNGYCGDTNGVWTFSGVGFSSGSFWHYSFSTGKWECLSWPQNRIGAASCYDTDHNRLWLIGGYTTAPTGNGDAYLQDCWSMNPTTGQWTGMPSPQLITNFPNSSRDMFCCYAPAFSTNGQQVILFGGADGAQDYGDTWIINTNLNTASRVLTSGSGGAPSNRYAGSMVWDSANNVALLIGGRAYDGTLYSDIYQYDPVANTWTNRSPTGVGGFNARTFPAVVYDNATNKIIIFGGIASGGVGLHDTWVLDNTANTITKKFPIDRPPVSADHTAPSCGYFNGKVQITDLETPGYVWEWSDSGTNWTQTAIYGTNGYPITDGTRVSCASNSNTGVWYHLFGETTPGVANDKVWTIDATYQNWVTLPFTPVPISVSPTTLTTSTFITSLFTTLVTLTNSSNVVSVDWTTSSTSGNLYTLPASGTLAPLHSAQILLEYMPTVLGSYSETLTFSGTPDGSCQLVFNTVVNPLPISKTIAPVPKFPAQIGTYEWIGKKNPTLFGVAFPFQKNATGLPAQAQDDDVLEQQIQQVLLVGVGERIYRPNVGSNVISYVFANNDSNLRQLLEIDIRSALTSQVKTIQVRDVSVSQDPFNDTAIIVSVTYVSLLSKAQRTTSISLNTN